MATFKTISSGSNGNAYILKCKGETLLIELGVKWKEILFCLDYDISNVVGCIVSHKHRDHSESVKHALQSNLDVYSCSDVQTLNSGVKVLKTGLKTRIEGFVVQPISVEHNVPCYAYIIQHKEFGKLLFVTDCRGFYHVVRDCNHILIECNWDSDVIIDNIINDELSRSLHENHLEVNQTIETLQANMTDNLKNIVLLHLSHNNIKPKATLQKVKDEVGFENVYIAEKGLIVEL